MKQGFAERGMLVAASGSHNALLIGSPTTPKAALAQLLATFLPIQSAPVVTFSGVKSRQ